MSGRHRPVEGADSPPNDELASTASVQIVEAMCDVLEDRTRTLPDRAAALAIVWKLSLIIQRRLRLPKHELTRYMAEQGIRQLGPLVLGSRAVGVEWPCNDPGNWTDDVVQETLDDLHANPLFSDYVRHVPEHYEIDTAALGKAVAEGSENARELHRSMKAQGWRTEESREPALTLKEGKKA